MPKVMLNAQKSAEVIVAERCMLLCKEYGLVMTDETERRLCDICNLSDILVEKGIKEGIKEDQE